MQEFKNLWYLKSRYLRIFTYAQIINSGEWLNGRNLNGLSD